MVPRLKQFTVVGTFDAGHYEYDSTLALVHVDDAAQLFRARRADRRAAAPRRPEPGAPRSAASCAQQLGPQLSVRDWTRTNSNWFAAVQLEKRLMFIILTLIVAVAAFNLVSTLVMTVTDKQRRHRDPAHARREPALGDGDLHGAGRAVGHHRHASPASLLGLVIAFNIDISCR